MRSGRAVGWWRRDAVVALLVAGFAALVMAPNWGSATYWETDGLFYEAQKRELQGESRAGALDEVFSGPLIEDMKEREAGKPPHLRSYDDPEWVEYSSGFYRRRWTVPAAAAAVDPWFGAESLRVVAMAGFIAVAVFLYLLLRRRFSVPVSLAVTLPCLLLPPLRYVGADAGTDSWGLALLIAGLLAAALVLERGRRWLIAWVAAVVLLAFTRDLAVVLVVAAGWVALRERTGLAVALAATGLLAALPAPLLFEAPVGESLAYVIDDHRIPLDASWGYVAANYPGQLLGVFGEDLAYPFEFRFPVPVLLALALFFAGSISLLAAERRGDRYFTLMRAALGGGFLTILLSAHFTVWRLELAMLPAAAVGVAILAERFLPSLQSRMRTADKPREIPPVTAVAPSE